MKKKAGYILLAASFLLYAIVAAIPFLGFPGGTAAIIITILIVTAELSFLASVYLLGRELVKKYRSYLNPVNWFRKKDEVNKPDPAEFIPTEYTPPEEIEESERKNTN